MRSPADAQQKGKVDAERAMKSTRQEGFTKGTIIFLDMEEGGRLSGHVPRLICRIGSMALCRLDTGPACTARRFR